jgi:hypothetical protein
MKKFSDLTKVLGFGVLGFALAAQACYGIITPQLHVQCVENSRGGCYSTKTSITNWCQNHSSSQSCGDVPCTKGTGPNGATVYTCHVSYLLWKEYDGYLNACDTTESGKFQCMSTTFYCSKKQLCNSGQNTCTEVQQSDGTIQWRCTSNGGAFGVDQVNDHYAGGSNC